MRQKFLISLAFIFLIILLAGLNAATYVRKEKVPDSESNPNRSTYNAGATGTRALYDLLAETGKRPARWQESVSALSENNKNAPSTFVVVGRTRREFTDREIEQLLKWVSLGGKLVIIDREPPEELIKTTANWSVKASAAEQSPSFDVDVADQKQMTEKTVAAKPSQPTIFTQNVNAVQSSRFASGILFEHFSESGDAPAKDKVVAEKFAPTAAAKPANANQETKGAVELNAAPPKESSEIESDTVETAALTAPVVHLASGEINLLVDFPFGSGQIVFLSDPFVVSNGGINLVDNARLAVNVLTSREGIIAFDEYHQGYGASNNRLLEYFSETPLVAIFVQFAVLIGLILFANSRRFARALPENEPNRLSKLEYVSAMAELQQRTKAFDLAVENIYTDFRRRTARLLGADNYTISLRELAKLIGERTNETERDIENLMFKCEEIVRGEPTNKREVLQITSRLRQLEEKLGLQRRKTTRHNL